MTFSCILKEEWHVDGVMVLRLHRHLGDHAAIPAADCARQRRDHLEACTVVRLHEACHCPTKQQHRFWWWHFEDIFSFFRRASRKRPCLLPSNQGQVVHARRCFAADAWIRLFRTRMRARFQLHSKLHPHRCRWRQQEENLVAQQLSMFGLPIFRRREESKRPCFLLPSNQRQEVHARCCLAAGAWIRLFRT